MKYIALQLVACIAVASNLLGQDSLWFSDWQTERRIDTQPPFFPSELHRSGDVNAEVTVTLSNSATNVVDTASPIYTFRGEAGLASDSIIFMIIGTGTAEIALSAPGYRTTSYVVRVLPVPYPFVSYEQWCSNYFGTSLVVGIKDADGDGASNQEEYMAQTDPTNRVSYFGVTGIERVGNGIAVKWRPVSGGVYRVETCTNVQGGSWVQASGWSNLVGAGGDGGTNIVDAVQGGGGGQRRYYRVWVGP